MKIKTVLKGIGRLMLTTAVMCGVGLFLCSSEVKADSLSFNYNGDKIEIVLTVDTAGTIDLSSETFEVYKDSSSGDKLIDSATLKVINGFSDNLSITTSSNNESVSLASIDKAIFLENIDKTKLVSGENKIVLKCGRTGINTDITLMNSSSEEITVFKIEAPSLNDTKYDTDVNSSTNPTYTITTPSASGTTTGYGYKGEKYTITSSALGDNYYVNYGNGSAVWSDTDAFKPANTPFEGTLGITAIPTDVQYFPKFNNVWFEKTSTGSENVYLDDDGKATYTTLEAKFDINNLNTLSKDRGIIMGKMAIVPDLGNTGNYNIAGDAWSSEGGSSSTKIEFGTTKHALSDINYPGIAKVKAIALKPNGSNGEAPPINDVQTRSSDKYLTLNLYAKPTGIAILKNGSVVTADKINVSTTPTTYTISVLPGGADQSIGTGTTTISGSHSTAVVDLTNKTLKVTGQSAGTDTITVTASVKIAESTTISKSTNLAVTVVALDKDKTISKINESNENYITVGDYKLDVASLVSKYATDGTNHIDGITPKAIKITSGPDYAEVVDSTKIKGKKEGTVELSIFLNTTDTSTTPDLTGVKIGVYPKPTATYSSSNRTLTVKMPTKVSTGYGEEKNIRKTTGFKLLLEDSSGNTLYEYTDSKYQKVLSSSSDKTVSYTVTASDIEGMVTSAASNGKFSSDTTSVKFKVIPMGYKQSNSEDETIKAKDEIAGTTDAVTVYKVSASGTNFTSTAAYGLDGQTVSLTATPNSGYTFKQWSDGNTSNPRQIKVSASGTRSFQAVAGDRVANSTGAGGTDNSALYDDVPKTSESNSAIWLIVFMVFAVMGTTYALYLQLRAANSKHDR